MLFFFVTYSIIVISRRPRTNHLVIGSKVLLVLLHLFGVVALILAFIVVHLTFFLNLILFVRVFIRVDLVTGIFNRSTFVLSFHKLFKHLIQLLLGRLAQLVQLASPAAGSTSP